MNRWVHAGFALVALSVILALLYLAPEPDPEGRPQPGATGPTGPTGAPTSAPTLAPSTPVPPTVTVSPPGAPTPSCPGETVRLRVATFNIHGGIRGDDRYDLGGIAEEIRSWDADVVLLQEVHRFRARSGMDDQPAVLGRMLGMHAVFGRNVTYGAQARGAPRREYGTAILSSRPIVDWSNRLLPNRPGMQQRGLLRATIRLSGHDVDLYNTHLQHDSAPMRLEQTVAIRQVLAEAGSPFVIGGDFNAVPWSPAMRVLRDVALDAWPLAGADPGLTAPQRVPRIRIDYLLHGAGGWIPEQAQVVRSGVSDHRAVLVDYALLLLSC
ncbi:endonuclease/exonuclease/phosphatase family protein [Nocardioides sp. cx-169]|uniref:endonuclease/exonuclease/phosphatase family protein n=1 Tax=Nocardioides sp. cx-169 TaxID=2899080 RepID=UPI0022AC604D|nr:endonuclease/exonuclease/phosphatase family protein [Nocardioides sp. cx-169]